MKKLMLLAAALVTLALVQGCASVQVADDLNGQKIAVAGSNVAHIYGQNWGIYCLSLPIVGGSVENPGVTVWGKDTVNVKAVTDMVTGKSKSLGATSALDLKSNTSGFWIMPTFVCFYRSVEVSGNAVK
jgi:hypothetical protein